jgi:integrase
MALKDIELRNAKPRETLYRLADGDGLSLQVDPNGSRAWRFRYRFQGRQKMLSLGTYPEVPLALARKRREEARAQVAARVDPSAVRAAEKHALAQSFEAVAREWYAMNASTWAPSHAEKVTTRLEKDVFPWLGSHPIASIEAPAVLECLRRVERRGAADTARRIRQYFGAIFRYAIATGRAKRDVAADLRDAIKVPVKGHYATITDPERIGDLLRAIDGYRGTNVVRAALALAPFLFVRPGELQGAKWSEIDLDAATWTIPAERRKLKTAHKATAEPHLVPLPRQAVAILRDLHPLTGAGAYVFPSEIKPHAPMSNGTINKGLRILGFGGEIVGHGFRHMASTLLHEQGFNTDWIERQLSHKDKNVIRGTYNRAIHMPERCKMMQAWADYLESLKRDRQIASPSKRAA